MSGSTTGGGLRIAARDQGVWTSPTLDYALTLHNGTDSEVTISQGDCAAMVANLAPGVYQTTWNGTAWSAPSA